MSALLVSGTVVIPSGRTVDVEGIDLRPGGVTFLRGPSGCGKTSLMRKLCGSRQYSGTLKVTPYVQKLAFVTHETTLIPWITVDENVALESRLRREPIPSEFAAYLEMMNLTPSKVGQTRSATLSLGMRQRVEIARALAFRPDLLLLDEAWSGVDAEGRVGVFKAIDGFLASTSACLFGTTHADVDVLRFGDSVYLFSDAAIPSQSISAGLSRDARMNMRTADLWQSTEMRTLVDALNE